VTTDDFLLDQVERSQEQLTRRRRDGRSRRRQLSIVVGLALLLVTALIAPSLVSHSSIGRSILVSALSGYGLQSSVEAMRIGWVTPLRISGLQLRGAAGSEVKIDQFDMDLTVTDLLAGLADQLGQISVRGVKVRCAMQEGRCNLEDDFQALLEPSGDEPSAITATLELQDISVAMTDAVSGGTWLVTQSNAKVEITSDRMQATLAGVLSEPSGSGGSLQGSIEYASAPRSGSEPGGEAAPVTNPWGLEIQSESLPLSVISLVRRRFPAAASAIPRTIHGDATGSVRLVGLSDGTTEMAVRGLQIRNLTAADEGSRVWNNGLATLDGDLVLVGQRVIGRQLRASTDFASATVDGAFSRSFSLVGSQDNPLRWLEAIDGTATAEIDLAAFDRSLPGILPLRDEAQIISGRLAARVDSSPAGTARRSQLSIRSDALRARAQGGAVVIDPIELTANVSTDQGQLKAERFEWKSAFGSAIGQGDLRSGMADFEIDFGRLTAMLRPIVQISETTLAGATRGNIKWNASSDKVWRLLGTANASNLLITLPSGHTLKRPSLHGEIEAVGRWGGQSLEELSSASLTLASSGLDVQAELVEPVASPAASVWMPVRVQGQGRIETLAETLGPWLPAEIHDCSGGFALHARADVSASAMRLTSAALELTEPRVAYAQRYFSQPAVKVHFDGDYHWPSQDLQARSLTVVGDAFSMAAKGDATAREMQLEVKWRAKLERLQGSLRKQIASRTATVQQVGHRPAAATDDWLVMGDCQGGFKLRGQDGQLDLQLDASGSDIAVIQPPQASAGFQTVGPMPRATGTALPHALDNGSRVVWSEPNLKIDGRIRYDQRSGVVQADSLQMAGDWFATTLGGRAIWNDTAGEVELSGPARLKMEEVARRLSSLAGTQIRAAGIHESPLEIRLVRQPAGELAMTVRGNLGWEASEVAGVTLGPASIPVRLTETSVEVAPSRVPVGQGHLNLSGQVHYRPGPLWMRIDRGVLADSIRLTPEMTDRWLKYLAPLAADVAQIEGTVGAEIDEAVIVFDVPQQSQVRGRLNLAGVQMTAGPMSNQIFTLVEQLKALARSLGTPPAAAPVARTLIRMPTQTVDFTVRDGIVTHERLFFEIDRASIVTSGRVTMDGRLDMIAQVPLDARWLGSDLQGLAGQPLTLPIDGTLSRPSLDSSGVTQVVQQLGTQAIQSTAENYLQQQLNRGFDKIFGR
jgi:hypothetical protein